MEESLSALARKPTRRRLTLSLEPNKTAEVEGFDITDFMQQVLRRSTPQPKQKDQAAVFLD
jgi:hypothetical protein